MCGFSDQLPGSGRASRPAIHWWMNQCWLLSCVKDGGHIRSPNQVVSGWLCPRFSWDLFCPWNLTHLQHLQDSKWLFLSSANSSMGHLQPRLNLLSCSLQLRLRHSPLYLIDRQSPAALCAAPCLWPAEVEGFLLQSPCFLPVHVTACKAD